MGRKKKDDDIKVLKQQLETAIKQRNFKEIGNIHNGLGYLYKQQGDYDEALEQHKKEAEISKDRDKMGYGIALRNIGEIHLEVGDLPQAYKHIRKYLEIAEEQNDLLEQQRAYVTLGRFYLESCEDEKSNKEESLQQAETNFRRALDVLNNDKLKSTLKEKEFLDMKCGVFHNIGLTKLKDKPGEALTWMTKVIDIAKPHCLYRCLCPSMFTRCDIYTKRRKFQEARADAKMARKCGEALSDISIQVDAMLQESKILLLANEIEEAKNVLKGVRKLTISKNLDGYCEDIKKLLIKAVKIIRVQDLLVDTATDDNKIKMEHHEKLGDLYSSVGNFTEAITHYHESITYAQNFNVPNDKLAKLYYSLAATYKDDSDEENALKYFTEEIKLYEEDPVEAFKTQTNIASCMEKLINFNESDVAQAYRKAVKFARSTGGIKREAIALNLLTIYQKSISTMSEEYKQGKTKLERLLEENYMTYSDLEESDPDSQDLLDGDNDSDEDIDLEALSSEDENDDEEETLQPRNVARAAKKFGNTNEFGETPVHVAAKRGDMKTLKKLLKMGFTVLSNDNNGWTPLHECANFGFYEIAEELIKHGANINDATNSEKLAPIHDAARNGHCSLVQLLIEKGAKIIVKSGDGLYPIHYLIMAKVAGFINKEDLALYEKIKEILKTKMTEGGRPFTEQDYKKANDKFKSESKKDDEFTTMTDRNFGDTVAVKIVTDDFDPDDPNAAVDFYSSTIRGLRSKTSKGTIYNRRKKTKLLITEEEADVQDNWLENDIGSEYTKVGKRKRDPMDEIALDDRNVRKNKRVNKRNDIAAQDIVGTGRELSPPPQNQSRSRTLSNASPLRQQQSESFADFLIDDRSTDCPVSGIDNNHDEDDDVAITNRRSSENGKRSIVLSSDDDENDIEMASPSKASTKPKRMVQTRLQVTRVPIGRNNISPPTNNNSVTSLSRQSSLNDISRGNYKAVGVLRLKIHVNGNAPFLVPVDANQQDETIEWLSRECSERYSKMHGVKPILRLTTKDGAHLSPMDKISLVLGDYETELMANIIEYDATPIHERFQSACKDQGIQPDKDILSSLNTCEASNVLNLQDFYLRGKTARAIFQVLQRQILLRELLLPGCSLYDEGLKELCKVLPTLPSITHLDISLNGITKIGLHHFTEVFKCHVVSTANQVTNPPLKLEILNLSHNPLGNSIGLSFSTILTLLTNLKVFSVSDCDFTSKLFYTHRAEICQAISQCKLEELDISYNKLDVTGLQIIFQAINVPVTKIKILDCTSCVPDGEDFVKVYDIKNLTEHDISLSAFALKNLAEYQEYIRLAHIVN